MNATTKNRVRLLRNKTVPEDRRSGASAGGPMVVGDVATLSFYTEHDGPKGAWKFEYMKARVVGRAGLMYSGIVIAEVSPRMISPEKLSQGMELTFDGWKVIEMEDAGTV